MRNQKNTYKESKDFYSNWWLWICLILLLGVPTIAIPLWIIVIAVVIYGKLYFKGEKFQSIKQGISTYIEDCNELNAHIEELRNTYANIKRVDYGEAKFQNISHYNYKKKGIANLKYSPEIYDCSRTVCDNARKQPFKYICKYFNIKADEKTLEQFENMLNNFTSAEEGKVLLENKKSDILESIAHDVPALIKALFKRTLEKELGFHEFAFNELYFPTFCFRYVSAGGNSGTQFSVEMNIEMLERFVNYLAENVKFRKSIEGQRRLMTPKLRQHIIERDGYTCQYCNNSTNKEPNLLLEVDHIIPLAKGGTTTEENLQTLCWKCNRHKGANFV